MIAYDKNFFCRTVVIIETMRDYKYFQRFEKTKWRQFGRNMFLY